MDVQKSDLKIAFVTAGDPGDRRTFSGITFRMLKSLQVQFKHVKAIGPVKQNGYIYFTIKVINYLSKKLLSKDYDIDHGILLSKYYARIINKRLKNVDFDLIFAPAASNEIAYLTTKKPIVYYTDGTFNQLKDYYGIYSNFSKWSLRESNFVEKKALAKSFLVILASKWASDYVRDHYHMDKNKLFSVTMGANIDEAPPIEIVSSKFNITGKCNLLFIGIDWERKGGAIAFEAFLELNKLGLNTELTVCGCIPPGEFKHPKMTVIPFLDKNDKAQYRRFTELLETSHFFILPTRAECAGIVFCEASAYGIPSITTDTGGVGSVLEDGVNGYKLNLDAQGAAYANLIKEIFDDVPRYKKLVYQSRNKYDQELNWSAWAQSVRNIIVSEIN